MENKEITPEQVERWKKEHGKVFYAEADGKKAWYRKPTRNDLSYAMTLRDKPLDMDEMILKNCFLGGEPFHEDIDYLLGMDDMVARMLTVKNVEVGEA